MLATKARNNGTFSHIAHIGGLEHHPDAANSCERRRSLTPSLLFGLGLYILIGGSAGFAYSDEAFEKTEYLVDALNLKGEWQEIELLRSKSELDRDSQIKLLSVENVLTRKLLLEFFEVNSIIAEVDREIAAVDWRLRQALEKRDTRVQKANILNFALTGTLNAIGNGITIPPKNPSTNGAIVGTIASGASTALSAEALRESASGKVEEHARRANMLIFVFDKDPGDDVFPEPPIVRDYLHRKSNDRVISRADALISDWKSTGLLRSKPLSRAEVDLLCNRRASEAISIDTLKRQYIMLGNLRALIFQMNKGLMKLTKESSMLQ